jgi:hypothetical protein
MPKPEKIDRHKCHGKAKEEKYKDLTALDYWWGLRELAADFDVANYTSKAGGELGMQQQGEIAYIQLLHYTVEVKLSGVFYQMETMERLFGSPVDESFNLDIRVFEAKEAFDALNEDMYQSTCAIANQLFVIMNRPSMRPIKVDPQKPVAMSPSELRYWLKLNSHPDFKSLSAIFGDCDNQLDIRHHATHYGAVPVYADAKTGVLYLQKNFRIGELLTKYDVQRHMKADKPMVNLVEAARPRAKSLCAFINRLYKYIWRTDAFENYLDSKALKIKDSCAPYWERLDEVPE